MDLGLCQYIFELNADTQDVHMSLEYTDYTSVCEI